MWTGRAKCFGTLVKKEPEVGPKLIKTEPKVVSVIKVSTFLCSAPALKITEALVSWRDDDGNSLLHLSAWKGRIQTSRVFFDSVKGRKLVTVQNRKGAVPLAMAIINGQVSLVLGEDN